MVGSAGESEPETGSLEVDVEGPENPIEAWGSGSRIFLQIVAAPVDGAANKEILRFVRSSLGVPRGSVSLKSGHKGRRKTVEVEGVEPNVVRAKWGL